MSQKEYHEGKWKKEAEDGERCRYGRWRTLQKHVILALK
jgi:hypothetical protein